MRALALSVLVGALAVGCAAPAKPVWSKAGAGEAERKKDQAECLKAALGGTRDAQSAGVVYSFDREEYGKCLEARGYKAQPPR